MENHKVLFVIMLLITCCALARELPDQRSGYWGARGKTEMGIVLGGDALLSFGPLLPSFGYRFKAGMSYQSKGIQIDGMLEYSYVDETQPPIWGSWSSTNTVRRLFPHMVFTLDKYMVQPQLILGIGSGEFAYDRRTHSSGTGELHQTRETIIGFGGGLRYKNVCVSARYYIPEVPMRVTLTHDSGSSIILGAHFNDRIEMSAGLILDF